MRILTRWSVLILALFLAFAPAYALAQSTTTGGTTTTTGTTGGSTGTAGTAGTTGSATNGTTPTTTTTSVSTTTMPRRPTGGWRYVVAAAA